MRYGSICLVTVYSRSVLLALAEFALLMFEAQKAAKYAFWEFSSCNHFKHEYIFASKPLPDRAGNYLSP